MNNDKQDIIIKLLEEIKDSLKTPQQRQWESIKYPAPSGVGTSPLRCTNCLSDIPPLIAHDCNPIHNGQ